MACIELFSPMFVLMIVIGSILSILMIIMILVCICKPKKNRSDFGIRPYWSPTYSYWRPQPPIQDYTNPSPVLYNADSVSLWPNNINNNSSSSSNNPSLNELSKENKTPLETEKKY